MEKISGILKGSQRVTAVDMKEAAPIRPGTPSFGRPEGVSSLKERAKQAEASELASRAHDTMMHWRSKEGAKSKVAEDMADRFFSGHKQHVVNSISKSAPDLPSLGEADVEREPASEMAPMENPLREEPIPGEFYPKGSFIDAVA